MAAAVLGSEGRAIKQKRTRKRDGARGEAKRRDAHRGLEKRNGYTRRTRERRDDMHIYIYV